MKDTRLTRLMLQPSTIGLLGIGGLSIVTMLLSAFLYTTHNGLFYDYLFGQNSSATLIETSRSTIAVFNQSIFGNPTLNKLLFFVFWMVIGLVVYVIVSGLGASASSAGQMIEQSRFVNAQKQRLELELGTKVVLHLIGSGVMVMWLIAFFKILLPFGVLCARIVAGEPGHIGNWLYGILGFIVLAGSFYLGLICVRFLLLRPRIFGGLEDFIEDDVNDHSQQA